MKNYVRITSGEFRGRKIETPGDGTHPMGERERLALFNMITERLPGAMVLDAFAGSGALGVEALSRGAKGVVFVDASRKAVECIRNNLSMLDIKNSDDSRGCPPGMSKEGLANDGSTSHVASNGGGTSHVASNGGGEEKHSPSSDYPSCAIEVICTRVKDFETEQKFDIILADPPYDNYRLPEIKHLVSLLKPGGLLVLSHPGETPVLPELILAKSRKYAGATISIFRKN